MLIQIISLERMPEFGSAQDQLGQTVIKLAGGNRRAVPTDRPALQKISSG